MRAFLAIELPIALRRALSDLQNVLADNSDGWRWARPEGMHLTLRFLGEVSPEDVTRAGAGWRAVVSAVEPFTIRIAGLGAFPSERRPRVIWAGVNEEPPAGRLIELANGIDAAGEAAGLGRADRPFAPHLTLARAATPGSRMPILREPLDCGTAAVAEVVLFRSELRPQGALHTPLERFALNGGVESR